ncbi:MAG: cation:proton antiporter [Planctomycetota bacterium]|jgi:multicomponent Na+:H+ antiporter subunit F
MTLESLMQFLTALNVSLAMLGTGLVICLYRVVRGPSIPDRVVALDVAATLVIAIVALASIASDHPVFLKVSIVIALLSFLGTVSFANYMLNRGKR